MGGAVSLLVNAILFPIDPILLVARAAQPVFLDLGASLDAIARGLKRGDVEEARAGLERARALDDRSRASKRQSPSAETPHAWRPHAGGRTASCLSTTTPSISSIARCATRAC
jgi:hypothetical protein